jgi:hypothetical protein
MGVLTAEVQPERFGRAVLFAKPPLGADQFGRSGEEEKTATDNEETYPMDGVNHGALQC